MPIQIYLPALEIKVLPNSLLENYAEIKCLRDWIAWLKGFRFLMMLVGTY